VARGGLRQGQRLPPYIEAIDLSSEQHDQIRTILQAQRPKVRLAASPAFPDIPAPVEIALPRPT
jgi:hypothetical protein